MKIFLVNVWTSTYVRDSVQAPTSVRNRKTFVLTNIYIFVIVERRNRSTLNLTAINYHEYIPCNWIIYNLSPAQWKEVLSSVRAAYRVLRDIGLAADVIACHVRANEIEVNAARGRNPKKNRVCMNKTDYYSSPTNPTTVGRAVISKRKKILHFVNRLFYRFWQLLRSKNIAV